MSLKDYHMEVCQDRCDHGVKVRKFSIGKSIKCLNCECKRPACEIYNICCEELSEARAPSNSSELGTPEIYCDTQTIFDFHFLYIRSCPDGYHDNEEIQRLCIENITILETTRDTFIRVIYLETQVVYYNMYCARCNKAIK
ncbi:adhesion G protein-coupled receptor L3, partial [Biomphalaria glabrata]